MRSIITTIGTERFSTYLKAAGGDERRALCLYQLNGRLSAEMHELIGGFEIALRNAVSISIEQYYVRRDWFSCRAFLMKLSPERRANIREVRRRIRSDGRDEHSGRIIAGLTFHFWVALHENKYRDSIWTAHLYRIWPKGTDIKAVHKDLLKIRDLRNRIAHHEPVFAARWHGRLEKVWLRFAQLAPDKAAWYNARCAAPVSSLLVAIASLER